jgi:hypothetical protein
MGVASEMGTSIVLFYIFILGGGVLTMMAQWLQ